MAASCLPLQSASFFLLMPSTVPLQLAVLSIVVRRFKAPGTTRIAKKRKGLGVKFSGLSQEAADFLFSRSGKCQVGQKPLRHMGKHKQTEDHCLRVGRRGESTAYDCPLRFSGNILYIKRGPSTLPQIKLHIQLCWLMQQFNTHHQ